MQHHYVLHFQGSICCFYTRVFCELFKIRAVFDAKCGYTHGTIFFLPTQPSTSLRLHTVYSAPPTHAATDLVALQCSQDKTNKQNIMHSVMAVNEQAIVLNTKILSAFHFQLQNLLWRFTIFIHFVTDPLRPRKYSKLLRHGFSQCR